MWRNSNRFDIGNNNGFGFGRRRHNQTLRNGLTLGGNTTEEYF
jgi:hypothetical protein